MAPEAVLADDLIVLRLPDRSDAVALKEYASVEDGLSGVWVPLAEGASLGACEALVEDWLAGWRGSSSAQGPALVVAEPGRRKLVGQVGFGDRTRGVVELVYGIAPDRRGRGYASRAAGLAARWLLAQGRASEVELRIGKNHLESVRVAAAAGFTQAGTVVSRVAATGEAYEDLRFVMGGAPR